MNARDRGVRRAGLITAALAATGVAGSVAVAAVVNAQHSAAQSGSTTSTERSSATTDQSSSDSGGGVSGTDQSAHARSGGS